MQREHLVALYIRVSSEAQVDGYSLEAQEASLRQEAKRRGKEVYRVYRDAGISGIREDRKGLNELLKDAKKGCFSEVLVWTVSRISRKLSYLLKIVDELKQADVTFFSLTEQFDITTPMGQFALTMMGAVAQMQRESWMESSLIGMKERVKSGRWQGGMMLGYQMVQDDDDPRGGGQLICVPEEAEIVKTIFTLYASGLGYKAIVGQLNAEGKTGKTGRPFTLSTVKGILSNAVYIGKVRFRDDYYDGNHEPIISQELWDEVQEKLADSSKPVQKTIGREYLLSGIIKCPSCGSGMTPQHTKNQRVDGSYRINHYYKCGAYLNKGKTACQCNSVRADDAEETVLAWLQKIVSSPFWIRRITQTIKDRYEAQHKPIAIEHDKLVRQIEDISRKQNQLLRQYEDELIERIEFLAAIQKVKTDKEAYQTRLANLNMEIDMVRSPHSEWSADDIKGAFRAFAKVLEKAHPEQKRQLIRNLIAKITVNERRQVSDIELRLPLAMNEERSEEIIVLNAAI